MQRNEKNGTPLTLKTETYSQSNGASVRHSLLSALNNWILFFAAACNVNRSFDIGSFVIEGRHKNHRASHLKVEKGGEDKKHGTIAPAQYYVG